MRILFSTILSLTSLALFAFTSGCGTTPSAQVKCTTQNDCMKASGTLFPGDASVDFLPQCCASVCVVKSIGCVTGFRYLTSAPTVGECVPTNPMCPAPPPDLLSPSGDM
jgi:hypothetical protein